MNEQRSNMDKCSICTISLSFLSNVTALDPAICANLYAPGYQARTLNGQIFSILAASFL